MLCSKIVFCFCFDIQNSICTQHVLNLYFWGDSMNNLLSYCGLTDSKMRASGTDLPVIEENLLFEITCSKKAIMEEVILRFPHLAKNIFEQVNFRSLANCSESSKLCRDFLNEEKILQKNMIQEYTKCSRGYFKVIY